SCAKACRLSETYLTSWQSSVGNNRRPCRRHFSRLLNRHDRLGSDQNCIIVSLALSRRPVRPLGGAPNRSVCKGSHATRDDGIVARLATFRRKKQVFGQGVWPGWHGAKKLAG